MSEKIKKQDQRVSMAEKNAKGKQWYKNKADALDNSHDSLRSYSSGGLSEYKRMRVNYDLYNNILNLADFSYICEPFGAEAGELPAKMVNRDIVSGKIKALLGMEMKRPFPWRVMATNPEATTRREQEQSTRLKQYVESMIMAPIKEQIEMKYQQEAQGRELTPEEMEQIQQKIAEETKAMTPPEVLKYMKRDHQDPAEVLSHQLLEYLIQKTDIKRKFNDAFKHLHLSAKEIMYVGILNGEPQVWNVNSVRFNSSMTRDQQFVEDGEDASCEYRMSPSDVVKFFGDELTNKDIDDIYANYSGHNLRSVEERMFSRPDSNFDFSDKRDDDTVRVLHCVWKSLRKIGFLLYIDEEGNEQETIVFEDYRLDYENGDVAIEWEWIPEVYETWKIGKDKYVGMQPVAGQFKDLDNLYHCKLPYYGAVCDGMNSTPTCLMDRLKVYQYYYNIVMYRLELLLASDKGKKVMMNINAIPKESGMDIKQWQYFFESSPFMWTNPEEEGAGQGDVTNMAKVIDLSTASDIGRYIELAEYLKRQAGESVGITAQVEGQIGPNDAVSNTRQNLVQTSHILEPYFEIHNHVKRNVLQALIETAKVAYSQSQPEKLNYFLDDMSRQTINMDIGLLEHSTIGLFVSNTSESEEAMQTLKQLSHAAMQTGKAELSDVLSVLRQKGLIEAEETLKVAEDKRRQAEQQAQQQQIQAQEEADKRARQAAQEDHEMEKEKIILKEEEKRKTEVTKASIMAASFNPDLDADNDGVNDFIEIARDGVNADIKREELQLQRDKLSQQTITDNKKLELEEKKLKIMDKKAKS